MSFSTFQFLGDFTPEPDHHCFETQVPFDQSERRVVGAASVFLGGRTG
jgi:hypothetical protein